MCQLATQIVSKLACPGRGPRLANISGVAGHHSSLVQGISPSQDLPEHPHQLLVLGEVGVLAGDVPVGGAVAGHQVALLLLSKAASTESPCHTVSFVPLVITRKSVHAYSGSIVLTACFYIFLEIPLPSIFIPHYPFTLCAIFCHTLSHKLF